MSIELYLGFLAATVALALMPGPNGRPDHGQFHRLWAAVRIDYCIGHNRCHGSTTSADGSGHDRIARIGG